MSDSDSPPPSENSSSSDNESSGDSSTPSGESSSPPPSQDSVASPPAPKSSPSPPSPPSSESSTSPPSSNSSTSAPPSSESSTSPPSESSISPPSSNSSSSAPPSSGSSTSPPSESSTPPSPSNPSSSSPPSSGSSTSPPSESSTPPSPSNPSSSSPPSSGSSTSPPSESNTSPLPSNSSPSTPPSSESITSPPSSNSSHSSPPGTFDSSSSSPSPPTLIPPPSSPSSSDGDSSPPASSKSTSSPPPPESSTSDDSSSSSPSSLPSPHSQGNQKADESPPAVDEKSPPKQSQSPPARSTPHLSPPSSGPSKASFDRGGISTGAVVSLVLVGVAITLIAIFFVIARRKKRRMHSLVDHYQQPPSFSLNSGNYYHRNENPMGRPSFSDPHHGTPPRLSNAPVFMYGSQRSQGYFSGPDPSGNKSCFSYEELMGITNGFSSENLLGEGGFGCVYKGTLPDGKHVAVKQLKVGGGQGEREFRAEVEIISRVHHRHLVSLVGYSISENERLLVYDFVPNKTLEHHLHGNGLPVMEWPKRQKIAIGSAKGLAYLHEDCHPRIIHRDIKSANILIDNDWEAQVADFGLAKLSNDTHTHVSTRIMGTFGYLAPEYASSGKLTDRSDVFSFGVVLLELITGRKPVDASQSLGNESLVEWARPLLVDALETKNFYHLVDQRLGNNYAEDEIFQMIKAAAACVRHSAPKRPPMIQVVRALDCKVDMTDLSNGMNFGQSQVYDSGQYSADIHRFRRTALGIDDISSDYGYSDEYDRRSREYRNRSHELHDRVPQSPAYSNSWRSGESSGEYHGEAETRAMVRRPGERSDVGSHRYGSRAFL